MEKIRTIHLCLLMAYISLVVSEPRAAAVQFFVAVICVAGIGDIRGREPYIRFRSHMCVGAYVIFGTVVDILVALVMR